MLARERRIERVTLPVDHSQLAGYFQRHIHIDLG
jgi:hypothetical protein